jgi:hypothetical protein
MTSCLLLYLLSQRPIPSQDGAFPSRQALHDGVIAGSVRSECEPLPQTQESRVAELQVSASAMSSATSSTTHAQDGAAGGGRQGTSSGLGFTAGLVSGVGFAYRRHFENQFGMQLGGIAWETQTSSFMNAGAELIRTLSRSDKVRFYGVVATSVFRERNKEYVYSACYPLLPADRPIPVPCEPVEAWRTSGSVNVGAGIGLEFDPGRHVGVSLELPLTLMLDLEPEHRWSRKGIYPIPSVSLVYYF